MPQILVNSSIIVFFDTLSITDANK